MIAASGSCWASWLIAASAVAAIGHLAVALVAQQLTEEGR